jgi:hypothetical protein
MEKWNEVETINMAGREGGLAKEGQGEQARLSRDLIVGFVNVQPHFWLFLALYGSRQ